jgi:hypothetical protein
MYAGPSTGSVRVHACKHTYQPTYLPTCIHTYVYTYIYTSVIHTRTRTHPYVHAHTHTRAHLGLRQVVLPEPVQVVEHASVAVRPGPQLLQPRQHLRVQRLPACVHVCGGWLNGGGARIVDEWDLEARVSTQARTYVRTYARTHTHTHTRTRAHTCTHTHTPWSSPLAGRSSPPSLQASTVRALAVKRSSPSRICGWPCGVV